MGISLSTASSNVQVRNYVSDEVSNYVSDDITFSILSKLPLKSLKRFECACKSWSFLFDNSYFMTMYRNYFLKKDCSYYDNTSLLILLKNKGTHNRFKYVLYSLYHERFENRVKLDWPKPSLPAQFDESGFDIFLPISFNGTLCLDYGIMRVVLWNPATNEFKIIPHIDPNGYVWANNHKVGYDHVKNDYKMLRRTHRSPKTDQDVQTIVFFWEIYSLSSNSWRKVDDDDDDDKQGSWDICTNEHVYMDGVSHWWWCDMNETYTWWCNRTYTYNIFLSSFDFGSESFITTPIPSYVNGSTKDGFNFHLVERHLMVLNGSIAFMINYTQTSTFHISILGELGVKESWTKLFIVGPLPYLKYPIGAGKKGNILIRKKDNELAWFDLSTGMIDEIGVTAEIDCKIVFLKESLLPIGGIFSNFSSCLYPRAI